MLFFNRVVEVELGAEREAREDQLFGMTVAARLMSLGHVTGVLEVIPGQTEMVMLGNSSSVLGLVCLFLVVRDYVVDLRTGPSVLTFGCRPENPSWIMEVVTRFLSHLYLHLHFVRIRSSSLVVPLYR